MNALTIVANMKARIEELEAENASLREQLKSVQIDIKRFEKAPCYLCGHNGPRYYQPESHPCASRYHAAREIEGGK